MGTCRYVLQNTASKPPSFTCYSPLVSMATLSPSRLSAYCTESTNSNVSRKRVGTHNGSFHCDEALGCFMIQLTNKFRDAEIVRTRDSKILDTLDAVLDVGGVYDPEHNRYDHHQKGFNEMFGHGFTTKLSSAGLVYKHYGMEIIARELQQDEGHPDVFRLYLAVYKNFIEEIDANDNGINQYDTDQPPKYVSNTSLPSRVGRLNLDLMGPDQSPETENVAFQKATHLAGTEFFESIHFYVKSWLPARSIVLRSLTSKGDVHPSGEIMVLSKACPLVASPTTENKRRRVWEKTHTKKDGSISDASSSYFDQIAKAKETVNDSDEDKLSLDEDILPEVFRMAQIETRMKNLEGKIKLLVGIIQGNMEQGNHAPDIASYGRSDTQFVAPQFTNSTNVVINQKCEILNFDEDTIAIGIVCRDSTSSNIHGKTVPSTHEKLVLDNILLPDERTTKINHQFAEIFGDVGVGGYVCHPKAFIRYL